MLLRACSQVPTRRSSPSNGNLVLCDVLRECCIVVGNVTQHAAQTLLCGVLRECCIVEGNVTQHAGQTSIQFVGMFVELGVQGCSTFV